MFKLQSPIRSKRQLWGLLLAYFALVIATRFLMVQSFDMSFWEPATLIFDLLVFVFPTVFLFSKRFRSEAAKQTEPDQTARV